MAAAALARPTGVVMPATRLIDRATWLLRRAATVAVALPLLVLVLMLGELAGGGLGFMLTWSVSALYSPTIAWNVVVAAVAGAWTGLYTAVPSARFVMRMFPLRADGRRRWGVVMLLTLMAALTIAFTVRLRLFPSGAPGSVSGPERLVVDLAAIVTGIGVLATLYLRPDARWPGRRVLYLRRFRSFSDRVVYRTLLSAMPVGARVSALVPAHGGPRDLDPFTIAFAGMRWRWPVSGMPRLLVSENDKWQRHVQRMIEQADCVVVDGSADSEAMAVEYALLDRLQAGPRTLVLRDASATGAGPVIPGATTLLYRRSPWPSVVRGAVWLALFAGFAMLSWRDSYNFPVVLLAILLLMLPAIFQRSVERASLRALKHELEHRVRPVGPPPLPWVRAGAATLALAAGLWVALAGATAWWRPLPAGDPRSLDGLQAPWAHQTVRIGQQWVELPLPPGFVNPKDLLVDVRGKLGALPGGTGQVLGVFIPAGAVLAIALGRPATGATMVSTLPADSEAELIDVATFQARYSDTTALEPLFRSVGATRLAARAAGPRALLITMDMSATESAPEGKACAAPLVLVQGKPLGTSLCRPLVGDGSAERRWVRTVAERWLDEVQQRNPALPPVRPGRLGMSGTVSITASMSAARGAAVETLIRVDEVVPGTPSFAAGLQPGDEIVAIDGEPLAPPDGQLSEKFAALASGAALRLDVRRAGTVRPVHLVKP